MERIEITEGVGLTALRTDKFVRTTLCYSFIMSSSRHIATGVNLISAVFNANIRSLYNSLERMNGAEVYSSVVKKGGYIILALYGECEPCFLDEVNKILSDTIFNLDINSVNTMQAIASCTDCCRLRLNDKRGFARERCIELLYKEDAFGVCGDGYEELFGEVDICGFYDYMLSKAEIEVFCIGDITDNGYSSVYDSLCVAPRAAVEKNRAIATTLRNKRVNDIEDVNRCSLCIAYSLRSGDYEAQLLANELLGGSAGSELFNSVREGDALCYYIAGRLYRYRPLIIVEAGIAAESCEKVVDSVDKAIGGFTADEEAVNTAKAMVCGSYVMLKDLPSGLADFYLSGQLLGDGRDIDEFIRSINAVDIDRVNAALKGCERELVYTLGGLQ
jgi:hypothetical protein